MINDLSRKLKADLLLNNTVESLTLIWPYKDFTAAVSHVRATRMMLQICQLSISEYRHCLQQQDAIRPEEIFNQRQLNVQCVFVLICVRAAETGLVICRKPRHIERLCTGDERQRSHLTAIRDRSCFSFSSVTVYRCDHEGVTFPSMLQGSSVVT